MSSSDQDLKKVVKAIIVDLDGTLALMTDRRPFDWHLVHQDLPNQPVIDLVRRYAYDHAILIVTGRDEVCLQETRRWLRQYWVPFRHLFMRPEGDHRKDAIVKQELYERQIQPLGFAISFCLDDRNQSVAFWRSLGLVCFQVAEGNF